MRSYAIALLLLVSGCSGWPADPDDTLKRIRQERFFNVGVIAHPSGQTGAEGAFLRRVENAAGASPILHPGTAETLLSSLEDGKLDLVVGEFHSATPWAGRVTLVPPPAKSAEGEHRVSLAAAARNGENAWITLLHEQAPALGADQ
jgi:hypothetical protein